ncbi:MAG: bifunctional demethylmenaquinone methyltransferase/2-methoxy-6-polyprenyl-1,4-benzoquinol methylase UbiE [Acidiferrobacteraceae bacterium]|nr:bifunctional demethylmenaquinone methyltransferase/2-methoxy-6-polyprenyl-1,4-benzoquinol methylase UbiE [Acidiferrobacteraceae bacterium]
MAAGKADKSTHFGFNEVSEEEKSALVGGVFESVANRYDLMNDLMSFGVHRLWKDAAVIRSGVRKGHVILDVAAGSCDLTKRFAARVGDKGRVVAVDISRSMLKTGRSRLLDKGHFKCVDYVLSDGEQLAFADRYFDCVSISFGIRNVTRIAVALESMFRVLRPGGRLVVLEFSKPSSTILSSIYDSYSFSVIPKIGQAITNDEASYRYLVESIRRHPDQETLRRMMQHAGFEDVTYENLSGGIVALHTGFKY